MSGSYRDLKVWQEAMHLVVRIYALTTDFPPQERYGIVQQMRRAAVSVPSNSRKATAAVHPGSDTTFSRTRSAPFLNSRRRQRSPPA
jgi:hypothetical protein